MARVGVVGPFYRTHVTARDVEFQTANLRQKEEVERKVWRDPQRVLVYDHP
jgi:hypothetical protein